MTISFGPVPPWNAPANEKIAYGVTLAAIFLCFSLLERVLPSRPASVKYAAGRRTASVSEVVLFVGMTVALMSATVGWPYLWSLLKRVAE
jgi:hypothetical protein